MAHEPKTAPKGAKTGGEYTLALNERHKILGACNYVTGILAWDFSQGMVLHFLLYKKLPLCNFVQGKFLFVFVF